MLEWAILVLGGAGAGFVNAVAGGGSALTLPILMIAGLDASMANGTNRLCVGAQAVVATATFHSSGVRPWRAARGAGALILLGAVAGAFVAVHIPAPALEKSFGVLFLGLALLIGLRPNWLTPPVDRPARMTKTTIFGFVAVGLYGGVFQAGVGIPMLLLLVHGLGLDLVRGNAAKVAIVLVYSAAILGIFSDAGQVDWQRGGLLSLGGVVGSVMGARAAITKGAGFIRKLVVVALVLAAIKALGVLGA
jgi:uncharacterized membrane protein YfcA